MAALDRPPRGGARGGRGGVSTAFIQRSAASREAFKRAAEDGKVNVEEKEEDERYGRKGYCRSTE